MSTDGPPPGRYIKGVWAYHPLIVSLANTNEPLYIVNRSGNRQSHEGAPEVLNRAITLCRSAGFSDILLRGDTDFSMTSHLDAWTDDDVRFVLGYATNSAFKERLGNGLLGDYELLARKAEPGRTASARGSTTSTGWTSGGEVRGAR